ncbi:putative beta-lysine N-acetyltransferase [Halobacillus locisalis]|uniref:Putative beta-lysine N-acetyltransferase n=1 Tax=Halobacillus locisalis TaxID=220753 RepID=A0A838CXE0_9BACI|nr:putative beta-lysine N-acetyltransferase [Halobacillus locisalis]MBA2176593.1 putative beta-lysine N-acetyltransferase [Halobacillus locisalis]
MVSNQSFSVTALMEKEDFHIEPISRRIKVYELPDEISESYMKGLHAVAEEMDCDKIIVYVQTGSDAETTVKDFSFQQEAEIKGFFNGKDATIYASFLDQSRNLPDPENVISDVKAMNVAECKKRKLQEGYSMIWGTEEHAEEMAAFYASVFDQYPTPIHDPEYIVQMMRDDVYFSLIYHEGELVSACSADLFTDFNAAEFTDCATLSSQRGKGLLSIQYPMLEKKMRELGVHTMFSYTRAISMGMNIVAAQQGFSYGGCMVQNSTIATGLEDMNIWYKAL